MPILPRVAAFHDEMTAWRRDLHAHPELGFEEHRTSDFVARKLAEFGCEVHRNIGKTGVVGVLQTGNGPSIGLRADMDALPIQEANDLPYRSKHDGRMHACGHDGHTAMLLGAARYLAETRNFDGTVHFIFQPAEEGIGGAQAMLADGLFQRFPCASVFGMHNTPGMPVGKFAIRPGAMMAGGAFFDVVIRGRGTHGARPEAGIDPVLTACHLVTALQAIVSRNISPSDTAVVSITAIEAGEAYNVIPETAVIRGTARTFDSSTMKQIEDGMRRTAAGIAAAHGAKAEVDFRALFAPLVNNADETQFMADVAAGIASEADVDRNRSIIMASEDFSFMLEACPGAYINLGNGDDAGRYPVHNPNYDFNDAALPYGASLYARLVEKKLPRLAKDA
ncbi:MAG: amidohydrolase [Hyphomicrobiaceae bacterium]|nr:MAG: amidohydrolase [Hyphomicrobiaceae bacterium]